MPHTVADLRAADAASFGGKARGLARLMAAGARVPQGIAVEATAGPPGSWPAQTRDALRAGLARLLAGGPVAVRSSAVEEDGSERSFAGMFESVLALADEEAALSAAARCIASGASERVLAYAGRDEPLPVGLVVQRHVAARAAGVCFTLDPTGRDRAVVVEAVTGTAERLVSGQVEPERWRLYRSGLGRWEALRDAEGEAAVLRPEDALAIGREAVALAERFGHPLDLEWAIDATGLWWLQARPITAVTPPQEWVIERFHAGVDDGPISVWSNWNVRETMPDPFTPLNWTLWRDVILPGASELIFGLPEDSPLSREAVCLDLVHGRIYWNMNAMLVLPLSRLFFGKSLHKVDAEAGEVMDRLLAEGVLQPRRMRGRGTGMTLAMAWAGAKSAFRLASALRPRAVLRSLEACAAEVASRPPVTGFSELELLREMRLMAEPESRALRSSMNALATAFLVYIVADHAFRDHPGARRLLAAGIEGNPTTAISLGLDRLVDAAQPLASVFAAPLATPELLAGLGTTSDGRAWLAQFHEFLSFCGQRGPKEFDLGAPRWSEDPTMLLDLVRAGLRSRSGERASDRLPRLAARRREAIAAAVADAPAWRRLWLRLLARLVELYMPLREAPKHYAMVVFQRMRQAALEMGWRLAGRGVIRAAEDLMFLEWDEVDRLGRGEGAPPDLEACLRERRALYARFCREKPPDFLRSDGVPVLDKPQCAPSDGVLRGVGISGGTVEGPARILRTPDPRAMADGDVIVVEFADPGWTPLFPRAGAVVMEVGGLMCHAAVVARELGIPAVFGVRGATRLLADGQPVRVDGEKGSVSRIS